MKAISFALLTLLAACNSAQAASPSAPSGQAVATVTSAAAVPPSTATEQPTASAPRGRPCSNEIARVCAGGMVDGCMGNVTPWHACVEPMSNPMPCKKELALKCGDGKTDACLIDPAATFQVCAMNEK